MNVGLTKNDWDLKVKMEDNSTVWDKIGDFLGFSGITVDGTNCPGFIKDGAVELIDFGFDFGTLRFFSLTNVLREWRSNSFCMLSSFTYLII